MFILFYSVLIVWSASICVKADCPEIIKKNEWNGVAPPYVQYLDTPLNLIVIQHTVTQSCSSDESCAEIVREIQRIHMNETLLWDIGPSFLIGNNGKIYEGRGWIRVPIHTYGYNNQSYGIAFIGTFNNHEPSAEAIQAARELIQCGVEKNRLSANYDVTVQSQLIPTESPGKKLSSKVMTWPDWTQDVSDIKKRVECLNVTQGVTLPISLDISNTELKTQALTSLKQIDLLSNLRDGIAKSISDIRNLALQTLKTVTTLLEGLISQATLLIDSLIFGLSGQLNHITGGLSKLLLFGGKDGTDAKIRACTNQKVKEIEDMIKHLGTLSSDAILFCNTAVEDTKNCTELNFGIQANTEACLNFVAGKTRTASNTYKSQRNLALESIQKSLNNLAVTLEQCSLKQNGIAPLSSDLPTSSTRAPKLCLGLFGC